MKREKIDHLIEAERENYKRRHPFLHKAIPTVATGIVVGVIIAGFVFMAVYFPEVQVRHLRFKLAGIGFVLLGVTLSLSFMHISGSIVRKLDQRKERIQ